MLGRITPPCAVYSPPFMQAILNALHIYMTLKGQKAFGQRSDEFSIFMLLVCTYVCVCLSGQCVMAVTSPSILTPSFDLNLGKAQLEKEGFHVSALNICSLHSLN